MNLRTFAIFIVVAGLLLAGYGGVTLGMNQPERFDSSKSKAGIFGGRDDIGNWLGVQERNLARRARRESATKLMIIGGVVLFLGVALTVAANKEASHAGGTALVPRRVHHDGCPACGQEVASGQRFCESCGARVR